MRNAGDGSMENSSRIRWHTEGGLLALTDTSRVSFWNRNHQAQTVEVFDLDDRLCAYVPDVRPTSAPE